MSVDSYALCLHNDYGYNVRDGLYEGNYLANQE